MRTGMTCEACAPDLRGLEKLQVALDAGEDGPDPELFIGLLELLRTQVCRLPGPEVFP